MSLAPEHPSGSSHRSGSNSLALGPQNVSERFMYLRGEVTMVPLLMTSLDTCSPVAVVTGKLKGMMSSSAV